MDMRRFLVEDETAFLREAAALVDNRLDKLERDARTHPNPDGFGLYDRTEYITGFGLVACQTYATSILKWSKLSKKEALKIGPKHRTGRPIIELVNAAANTWKHSPEWSLDEPSAQTQRTIDIITSLGVDTSSSYILHATLYRLLEPHEARIKNLIPFLTQWCDEVIKLTD